MPSVSNSDGFLPVVENFSTLAIHSGQSADQWQSRAVVPPISLTTTFKQDGPADFKQFEYSRSGNPSRNVLEACLASLDGAKHGLTFSSGLAATTTLVHLLKSGDHIIAMNDLYGGTNRYFRKVVAPKMNISTSFVDATDVEKVKSAIQKNTAMIWIETPTNPTLKITDIRAVCEAVKSVNANILVVVDNTFLTSYFQRPLSLGADLVVYSLTKYMNGHTDVVMGAVCTNSDKIHEDLRFLQNAVGPVPSPFDCFLVNRSLKTLKVRMEEHFKNGLHVAEYLCRHGKIESVIHPCLKSHPQHDLAKRQQSGYSGMITFYIKDGGVEESKTFLSSLKLITLAESLGGYESLAELPYLMTHASVEESERVSLGVTPNLIRLSVGLENVKDIIGDLEQALAKIGKGEA